MKEFLNFSVLEFGKYDLRVAVLLEIAILFVVTFMLLMGIRKIIFGAHRIELSKKYTIFNLVKYFVWVIAITMSLQIAGMNLSVLLAGSAALLVGFGLGIQNLFADFVSGIVLLIDSTVKVNDVIEVNGLVCRVKEIDLRTTTVITRDEKHIILPNSELTRNRIINWTHSQVVSRFEISVGVDYSSDVRLVMQLLREAALRQPGVLKNPEPFVRFTDFADSALQFSVIFWAEEVFRVETIKSEIRIRISDLFTENKITIPFPQRVVHFAKDSDQSNSTSQK